MAELSGRRFRSAPETTTITFAEGSPLYGLEVVMHVRLSVADIVRLGQAWSNKDPDEIEEASGRIGAYLVAWNLEEPTEDGDGAPVPATPEGWASCGGMTQVLVFQKFMDAINSGVGGHVIDVPLASASLNGSQSARRRGMTAA